MTEKFDWSKYPTRPISTLRKYTCGRCGENGHSVLTCPVGREERKPLQAVGIFLSPGRYLLGGNVRRLILHLEYFDEYKLPL